MVDKHFTLNKNSKMAKKTPKNKKHPKIIYYQVMKGALHNNQPIIQKLNISIYFINILDSLIKHSKNIKDNIIIKSNSSIYLIIIINLEHNMSN